jgi:hypothetical protein
LQQIKKINFKKKSINILDFASGFGRHSIQISKEGNFVTAIDKDQEKLNYYKHIKNIETICFDLETNEIWPLKKNFYDLVIVTNYLYRPRITEIGDLVRKEGYILYETFSEGNEKYGKPKSKKFLLKERELIDTFEDQFEIIDYFNGCVEEPIKKIIQRCTLKKEDGLIKNRLL